MKTIYTTLPIYNKLAKQCYQRASHSVQVIDRPIAIKCPRYRLPSFQWLDDTDGAATVSSIHTIAFDGTDTDISAMFSSLPALAHDYFVYNGTTLLTLLTPGFYYLKITMNNGFVYYSEWFEVDCIYENLLTDPDGTSNGYDTMTIVGTAITSAINLAGTATVYSNVISIIKGETIRVILFFTLNSGELPSVRLCLAGVDKSNSETLSAGLNVVTLTATETGSFPFRISNGNASNFSITEIIILREYSEKYLILDFHNDCDLGDFYYHGGFSQTFWFESEPMENTYPIEEKGIENGEARFVRSFARQDKKYIVKTKDMPDYMVDVFNRLRLHDSITLTNLLGDINTVYNLEVEHEWLDTDKYYAKVELTFDYDEAVVIGGCCNNL
jgi:hypothetical protein